MKAKILVPFVFVLIALFTACDNDTNIPEIESTDYFPLHIGDTWEYKDHIRKVSGSEMINNKEYRVITHETYLDSAGLLSMAVFYLFIEKLCRFS